MEEVILVDEQDNAIGRMEKMEAHRKGVLHRAFSILVFNSKGQLLLQRRASKKYHSGGLWTNTCCSHPLPDEDMRSATRRKLMQEMGIEVDTEFSHKFIYKTNLENQLIEHELDHVFVGKFDGIPAVNPDEVEDWQFVDLETLRDSVKKAPDSFTYWFRLILEHPELRAA